MSNAADSLKAGREALEHHAWQEAYDLFREADEVGSLDPSGLELFFDASWWAGRPDETLEIGERAYAALLEEGQTERAALMAFRLGEQYGIRMAGPQAGGWLGRAEDLLSDHPDSVVHGYLAWMKGFMAIEIEGRYQDGLPLFDRALEVAERHGNRSLYGKALHDKGRTLLWSGHIEEGMDLLDQSMVVVVGGEMQPFDAGYVYCSMIAVCSHLGDFRRSAEWTEATTRWMERESLPAFTGICRIHRAELLRLRGELEAAEEQARLAFEELPKYNFLFGMGYAWYEIGEVRRRLGDYPAAEEAFARTHETGVFPEAGLSLVRLGQERLEAAAEGVRQALRDGPKDPLSRARFLAAHVQIALAMGDLDTAERASQELDPLIAPFASGSLKAMAEAARGAVLLARGDSEGSLGHLREALGRWLDEEAPYETAETRVLLASAHRALGEDETAALELRSARTAFQRMGARAAAAAAQALLDDLLGPTEPPERAVRAFMFTDIVRSTDLVGAIGDEAWEDLLAWHDQTLRALFASHQGDVAHHTGDGFFVAFPEARSALACAIETQRALVAHRREHGFAPQVRIGVHTAQATRRGQDYSGGEVHRAARIAALAEGGEILASAETVTAAGEDFAATELREVTLKGFSEPVRIGRVAWH